jgi:hypothetical protein
MKYLNTFIKIILISFLMNNFLSAQILPTKVSEVLNGKPVEIIYNNKLEKVTAGKWTQGDTIIPSPRYYAGSVTYTRNDTAWLYVFGGDTTGYGDAVKTCSRYNINTNTWELIAELPAPARLNSTARLGNKLYSFGGFNSSENIPVATIYEYDVDMNTWTQLPDMPEALYYLKGTGFHDSILYFIGGATYSTESNSVVVKREVRYTDVIFPSINYILADSLPSGLADGGTALAFDTLYYIGGFANGGIATAVTFKGVVDSIDRSKITWTDTTNYLGGPIARINAHEWGPGKIIIGGGSSSVFNSTSGTYIYDALTAAYTKIDTIPIPVTAYQSGTTYTATPNMEIRKYIIAGGITTGPALTGQTWIYTDTLLMTGIDYPKTNPEDFLLFQNYPNPFNPTTNIEFRIPNPGLVSLKVFDVLGKEVAALVNEQKPAGNYEVKFDGSNLPSGIYFYQLKAGNFIDTKKFLLLK